MEQKHEQLVYEKQVSCFFHAKREVSCMGYACKDVEKTKKLAKKFVRYMSLKNNLKPTTKSNYLYMYDRFIRDTFGKRNIAEIKYSDVVQFYNHLTKKQELKINTLETIHTLLHPTFQLAVRDDIIRKNPTDGVMVELKRNLGMKTGHRKITFQRRKQKPE